MENQLALIRCFYTLFSRSTGARKAILILIRQKPSVSYDPFYDGWPTLCDHWQSACADENRERSYGGACVAEMYVSF
jgi:hypothetical protein